MKTIVVATDFSEASVNAARYAAEMAIGLHKELLLLHVYDMPATAGEIPLPFTLKELKERAEIEMQKLQTKLTALTSHQVEIRSELAMGAFFEELEAICRLEQPYVVVMGSQGSTATDRFLFGSHTIYTMKHLKWTLLTVPPQAHYGRIDGIALACDFENMVDTTPAKAIREWVNHFGARLYVLNVAPASAFNPDTVFDTRILREMLVGVQLEYHFLSDIHVENALTDFIKVHKINLLMVLPKRRRLIEKIFHKSHTKQLILHSDVPVLALHY